MSDPLTPANGDKVVKVGCSRIWLGRDGVIRHVVDGAMEKGDLVAAIDTIRDLAENQPVPVLADFRGVRSFSREARRLASNPEITRKPTALALVVGNPVTRVIGTFGTRIQRPSFPVRLFTDPAVALAWAKQHRVLPVDEGARS
jgi:hypothetical protein